MAQTKNANGVKTNTIDPPIVTRFIRLMAVTWRRGIALRLELLGYHNISRTANNCNVTDDRVGNDCTHIYSNFYIKDNHNADDVKPIGYHVFNTSGNSASDGLAGNPAGTISEVVGSNPAHVTDLVPLGKALYTTFLTSLRRRSKDTGERETDHQPDETGTVDNIYYCGVSFAANGNASTDGIVSIGQSEGTVDNHLYTGTTNDNIQIDQSEGTVENHLYAGAGGPSAEIRRQRGDDNAQDNIYYNVAHTSDNDYVENEIY
ncbi:biological adhesion [Branchiostoma belcheri]|nr:biological adhesion [Branchiostoma belcheri]